MIKPEELEPRKSDSKSYNLSDYSKWPPRASRTARISKKTKKLSLLILRL